MYEVDMRYQYQGRLKFICLFFIRGFVTNEANYKKNRLRIFSYDGEDV